MDARLYAGLMQPPWSAFPDLPRGSGWRMGSGEDYYNAFYRMFSALSAAEQDAYARSNPEPREWRGFYAMIKSHPWL